MQGRARLMSTGIQFKDFVNRFSYGSKPDTKFSLSVTFSSEVTLDESFSHLNEDLRENVDV